VDLCLRAGKDARVTDKINPIRPTDEDARALARGLLAEARFAALGVLDPETGLPHVTRVAVAMVGVELHTLVSTLSFHTRALQTAPDASLLVGEPQAKGDPLTYPRITLAVRAIEADKNSARDAWLAARPKAKLYYDFTDFMLFRFEVQGAALNGGFGKAYNLQAGDLKPVLPEA